MRHYSIAVGFLLVLFCASSPAQRVSPDSLYAFFPTHVGDEWQFKWGRYIADPPLDISYVRFQIVSDTIMQNGMKYFVFHHDHIDNRISGISYQRLDSASGNVCKYIDSTHEDTIPLWWYAGTHPDTVLGVPTIVVGGGWTGQFMTYGYGFGLVSEKNESGGWPWRSVLLYARINGKEYGTPLSVPGPATQVRDFQLYQNYPNPFNPSTTIRYGLPHRSHVTLTVFNTLGQEIAVLQNGGQEAGYHEVKFDAGGLASGVYFYRMTAGSFVATKRLLLVR